MYITKKNGKVQVYDEEKVVRSILKANVDAMTEEMGRKKAQVIANEVFSKLTAEKDIISTEDVRTCTAALLREKGYPKTADCYLAYNGK